MSEAPKDEAAELRNWHRWQALLRQRKQLLALRSKVLRERREKKERARLARRNFSTPVQVQLEKIQKANLKRARRAKKRTCDPESPQKTEP